MKSRIIFVEDDSSVNHELKKMLRSFRRNWEMSFVTSGRDALDLLSSEIYDIIITDMHMPLMNGNELLKEVRELYPRMVRILISGHPDSELNMDSVTVAHQFLSKPYNVDTLKMTITKAGGMGEMLKDKALVELVNGLKSIPSVPRLYTEVVRELDNEYHSIKKIGELISRDIGMSAKVLQLINSAFFGLPQKITSPETAAVYLGMETLSALVLAAGVFSSFKDGLLDARYIDRIWTHSTVVGTSAMKIARDEGTAEHVIEACLLAGLLHDVGKLVLLSNMPDKYAAVLEEARKTGCEIWEAEKEIFGTTHCEVGAYLIGIWGLPWHLVEGILYHHQPKEEQLNGFKPLIAVSVADILEHEFFANSGTEDELSLEKLETVSELGFKEKLPRWRTICEETFKAARE